MAQNQVQIVVSGRSYTISADADREKLIAAVERVNVSIARYKTMQWSDELRSSTLSAVVFAYDLIELEEKTELSTAEYSAIKEDAFRLQSELNELLEKQNEVLGENGRLRDKFDTVESERNALAVAKESLEQEIEKLRRESELHLEEHESVTSHLILVRDQVQADLELVTRERDELKATAAERETASAKKVKDLQDEVEYQQLAIEEELESVRGAFEKSEADLIARFETERSEAVAALERSLEQSKLDAESALITLAESHAVELQLVCEQRDSLEVLVESLREQIDTVEQETEESAEREQQGMRENAELTLKAAELELFLTSLEEERELIQLERDELLASLTAATAERDGLRSAVELLQKDRENSVLEYEVQLVDALKQVEHMKMEKKASEEALMKMVGRISGAGIHLS